MHFFCIFLPKYLVMSEICSTFAPAFEKSSVLILAIKNKVAEIAQLVEHDLAKVFFFAQMAELVDACVSGAHAARCAGSSPVLGTKIRAGGEIGIHATLRG